MAHRIVSFATPTSSYSLLGVLFLVLLTACSSSQANEGPNPAEEPAATGQTVTVEILDDGGDMRFEPEQVEVERGDVVRFVQKGSTPHNVDFVRNDAPDDVDLGDDWTGPYLEDKDEVYEVAIDERFADGTYPYICTPHAAMGMTGTIEVNGGETPAAEPVSTDEAETESGELIEVAGEEGLQELDYEMDGDTKVFHLKAEHIRWETTEGKLVEAMAYNRQIPGPVIRVTEGDHVRIVVENGLDEPHTTHWHGLWVPNDMDGVPDISQDPIMPGESFTYEFEAKPAGTRLYHSHFNTLSQEGAGLYGMFIIEEEETSEQFAADHEEIMLLGDGKLGFVINGKEFPLTEPMRMKKGEKMRVRMANLGGMYHPMHMHGGYFTVVAKDGFPVENPQEANTISIAPGETWDVIVHPQYGGTWLWHCHVLSHATGPKDEDGNETSAGMIGVIEVEDGETELIDMENHKNH